MTRNLLEYCRFLEPVRDSHVADALWSRWNPQSFQSEQLRRNNLRALFDDHHVRYVFDIGANVGRMAALYASLGSRVVCVEPDPANVGRLRNRFRWNPRVQIEAVGVAGEPGRRTLHCYPTCRAYDTFSDKQMALLANDATPRLGLPVYPNDQDAIDLVTVDQLIAKYGEPDYAKIDVEGFELEVLRGLSHPLRLVSFECNLPEFEPETIECLAQLTRLRRDYAFNFWPVDHSFRLMSERWLTAHEMAAVVRGGHHHFMEIIAIAR